MAVYRKRKLVDSGEYDGEIVRATERLSRTGNEMFVVDIRAKNDLGRWFTIQDYLVLSDQSDWKFEQFLNSIGLKLEDDQQIHPEDFVGLTARVLIGIQEYEDGQRNCIKRWLSKTQCGSEQAQTGTTVTTSTNE